MDSPALIKAREPLVADVSAGGRLLAPAERRAKIGLTLGLWASNCLIFVLSSVLQHQDRLAAHAGVRVAVTIFGIGLCYALHRLLRRLAHRSFRTRAIVLMIAAPLAAETYAWITFFAFAWLNGKPMTMVITSWSDALISLSFWTWFYLAWAGLYLALEYSFDVKEEERRSSELRGLAQAAKLRALSNQINPHFLFNSLNAISSLMLDQRAAEAERMLAGLSQFLRRTLAIDPLEDIPLEREFDIHRQYLTIEQQRYPDLTVDVDLPAGLRRATVPALLLQPIVENAIKHGVAKSRPPSRIALCATFVSEQLEITVSDCGATPAPRAPVPASLGIGLSNVGERLRERFGERQSLDARPEGDCGFRVTVRMPLTFA